MRPETLTDAARSANGTFLSWRPMYGGVVDVLQVAKQVDCVVIENVRRTHALYHPSGVLRKHYLITPNATSCSTLAKVHNLAHVVCLGEESVFGPSLTLRQVIRFWGDILYHGFGL